MHALTALNKVVPGFEKAKLRNFNMRIGIRDTRKIVGRQVINPQQLTILPRDVFFKGKLFGLGIAMNGLPKNDKFVLFSGHTFVITEDNFYNADTT